jgi:hypothetical protein
MNSIAFDENKKIKKIKKTLAHFLETKFGDSPANKFNENRSKMDNCLLHNVFRFPKTAGNIHYEIIIKSLTKDLSFW